MNYPVWDIPFLGSGLVVAIIAIIHVLISHLAIGGGAFLFVAELWSGRRTDGEKIRAWLHRYATYFLVYTTVFGAVTGVGIWFAIQLASPEATSLLIHQFVFAWAIEWVMFLGELTTLYLYYYGWRSNSRQMQLFLAGAYFIIAWMSLFVINGILTFMLTPGGWSIENPDIVAGFFNPGCWPSLFFRTAVMLMLGGLFGIVVGAAIRDDVRLKEDVISFCSKWVIPAAIVTPLLFWWYWTALPEQTVSLVKAGTTGVGGGQLEAMSRYVWLAAVSGAFIVIGTLVIAARPRAATVPGAIAILIVAQFAIMGGEFFREMARKPYVVYGTLYSNGLWAKDAADESYLRKPYLEETRWDPQPDPLGLEHGEWVFRMQCVSCHTRHGYRSIAERTADWSGEFGFRWLATMHETGVMPPFQGDDRDRAALAAYVLSLNGESASPWEILNNQDPALASTVNPAQAFGELTEIQDND